MLYLYKILYLGHENPVIVFNSPASNETKRPFMQETVIEKT